MAGGDGGSSSEINLPYTPTWIVATLCSIIVLISLIFERLLHHGGKVLKRKDQIPLFDALQKIKEELMLLGFISLLMTVFQGRLQNICVNEHIMQHWLPCKKKTSASTKKLAVDLFTAVYGGARRLLAAGGSDYCKNKGKVPILSLEALHALHIFIFTLAVTHVLLSAITVVLGITQINNWRHWEHKIQQSTSTDDPNAQQTVSEIEKFRFIQERYKGFGKAGGLYGWLHAFFKQFYASLTEEDYITIRRGFINEHCSSNMKFDFYKYMMRALESDFKKVVGISWYLWTFVMLFLLLNVNGWHVYFWVSWVPLVLLLVVGAKLEHIITELAHQVAEKHSVVEGNLIVTPSDDLFWFHRPKIVLVLIHFILFQNAFEIAYFFWILTTYGFNSCIMGKMVYIIPRLIISVLTQVLCSYSTLPLYAIVSHMGSSFKSAIFEEHVHVGLLGWAEGAKRRKGKGAVTGETGTGNGGVEMTNVTKGGVSIEQGTATLISPRPQI
ncbi:MLO-like protein 1 isoform X1 [Carex littledalei]|uniref:MLO-like protein n=1 Tax=Carex littledalei TaxID=544730 RepID=A0A833RER7_9POAL|nr:MLO-like protein 1 isoform X1 [Carex littledalei]